MSNLSVESLWERALRRIITLLQLFLLFSIGYIPGNALAGGHQNNQQEDCSFPTALYLLDIPQVISKVAHDFHSDTLVDALDILCGHLENSECGCMLLSLRLYCYNGTNW